LGERETPVAEPIQRTLEPDHTERTIRLAVLLVVAAEARVVVWLLH
jgi:hypothetical protein